MRSELDRANMCRGDNNTYDDNNNNYYYNYNAHDNSIHKYPPMSTSITVSATPQQRIKLTPGSIRVSRLTHTYIHEALVLSNCLTVNNDTTSWVFGKQVMSSCHNLPPFTAVAAFDNNQYVSQGGLSGIIMECTTNGFKIAVQECGLDPAIVTITTQGVNLMDALNYYTIL
ncbi:uncharacterized protein LOC128242292 [Mya arenaria]|uniref:uncharacterized protein LOC128242292 n=1 Tax=Mya arenaria TaxID=6604 RepID=UPI0022E54A28|nr:uncharacterized protein LOC128242292 [Mya arenaria]